MGSIKKPIGIGLDLGSSSVRVGIFDYNDDTLIQTISKPVHYYYDASSKAWKYTQKSNEIIDAILYCLEELRVSRYDVKSCGIAATCSMVYFEKSSNSLNILDGNDNNVIFWMDSTASEEAKYLNERCSKQTTSSMGGNFIPEMGIPKLLKLKSILKSKYPDKSFEVFDLHKYIAYKLSSLFGWNMIHLKNNPHTNGIGHDGELSGWSIDFYEDVLQLDKNIVIGPSNISIGGTVNVKSCIDCYASWFSMKDVIQPNSVFIVAGTSSCYLYSAFTEGLSKPMDAPGVWGPFYNILGEGYVTYEGGSSCSGKLFEYLFLSHPAAKVYDSTDIMIDAIEKYISDWENVNQKPFYYESKYDFFYGDLYGNRTPYGDQHLRGTLIGISDDLSLFDLAKRYICTLECLAFQTKQMLNYFPNSEMIEKINICGSQANNKRLLNLLALITDAAIFYPEENAALLGVVGAYQLGKDRSMTSLVETFNVNSPMSDNWNQFDKSKNHNKDKMKAYMEGKFLVYLDMIERQLHYQSIMRNLFK